MQHFAPPTPHTIYHTAFYKFVPLDDPDEIINYLRGLTTDLLGSILVAHEGINGMVAGSEQQLDRFQAALLAHPSFNAIPFKRSACKTVPFGRMKVYRKPEIVPLGIAGVDARKTGINEIGRAHV